MRSASPKCSAAKARPGLVTYINTRVGLQIAGERLLLLADAH
jgi:hypothetical protein